jgi:spore germination protein YaaH
MKCRICITLASVLCTLCLSAIHKPVVAQEQKPSWCVSVWYPSSDDPSGFDSITNNRDVIDEINPFWYQPLPDGTLQLTPEAENADQLKAWRIQKLLIMPSIFSNYAGMIETAAKRADHINNIVALVERMKYDGIDIDYEAFTRSTRDSFSTFIEDLAGALHAHNYKLSLAVHAKTDDAGLWEGAAAQDWTRIAPVVDIFRVMTYDYHSRDELPGPIGPPGWSLDVLAYTKTIIPLSKVRLGLHFYGYSWLRGKPPATTISWASTQRWIQSFKLPITRAPDDQEAQVELKAPGLPRQIIYVADAASLQFKLKQILTAYPELGGASIWGIGGEDPANWDVLRKLKPGICQN